MANSLANDNTSRVKFEISTADSRVGDSDKLNLEIAKANSLSTETYQLTDAFCRYHGLVITDSLRDTLLHFIVGDGSCQDMFSLAPRI